MGNWTFQTLGYDTLNRLLNGAATSGPFSGDYGCWQYDPFGNRQSEAVSTTNCPQNPPPNSWAHYNTANQIIATGLMPSGYTYDAAGNVLNDGVNQYLYDGEGRICAVKGATTMTGYIYDAAGDRFAKGSIATFSCNLSSNRFTTTSGYVVGLSGEQLTETTGGTGWLQTHVFANGKLLATYSGSDTLFELNDWLGTRRADAGVSGCLTLWVSLWWGNDLSPEGSNPCSDTSELHFTGKERDSESGNDYFGARYYGSTMGRFMSPDPVFISAQRLMDPQSLNLYSYVRNNPLGLTDDSGLDFYLACQTSDHSGCGQVQNGSSSVWVQGQGSGKDFQAFDVDMNKQGDPSAGYSDQFGNQYSGSFDENGGVSFTNTATGATSSNSRFIDGSDETDVNGSGSLFGGTQGRFNSDCGGSCEAKGSLYDLPGYEGSVANAEKMIGASLEDKLNFFGGHGKSTSYRTGDGQLTHVVVHAGGGTEIHFEGHPPGQDLVNFVLHQVDAIRDFANHQSSQEPPLP